jgi:CheY-like chemotaxis protein
MMGGSLAVESRLGQGSIFWFDLALAAGQTQTKAASAVEKKIITGYEGPSRTILVVDDVPKNRAVLNDMLSALGFEVIETVDGEDALAKAAQYAPDIILMDLAMPKLDGFEATRRIRRLDSAKPPVILAVSARSFDDDRQESLLAGCDDFVAKPYRFEELLQKMGLHAGLTWRYDQAMPQPTEPALSDDALNWPDGLPLEDLTSLLELAEYGDIKALRRRLADLDRSDIGQRPLIIRLRQLAGRYQIGHIQRLLQSYLDLQQKEEDES